MPNELARKLYENGRWHALSGQLIQKGAIDYAKAEGIEDIERFIHNGPYSLALFQSIGLGLELLLKSALVELRNMDENDLKQNYGHDLIKVLDDLESDDFTTDAGEGLRRLVEIVTPPYKSQIFRYGRPDGVNLPNDMDQVFTIFDILDRQLDEMTG